MVEATTGWLETYPVKCTTARNIVLGLERQTLWQHGELQFVLPAHLCAMQGCVIKMSLT